MPHTYRDVQMEQAVSSPSYILVYQTWESSFGWIQGPGDFSAKLTGAGQRRHHHQQPALACSLAQAIIFSAWYLIILLVFLSGTAQMLWRTNGCSKKHYLFGTSLALNIWVPQTSHLSS